MREPSLPEDFHWTDPKLRTRWSTDFTSAREGRAKLLPLTPSRWLIWIDADCHAAAIYLPSMFAEQLIRDAAMHAPTPEPEIVYLPPPKPKRVKRAKPRIPYRGSEHAPDRKERALASYLANQK